MQETGNGEIQTTAVVVLHSLLTTKRFTMLCPHLLHGIDPSSIIVPKDIGGLVPLKQWPYLEVIVTLVHVELIMFTMENVAGTVPITKVTKDTTLGLRIQLQLTDTSTVKTTTGTKYNIRHLLTTLLALFALKTRSFVSLFVFLL